MAVLLVGMAITAVLMTVAMPVWKQSATREKEAELIFRGQQYVRAIGQFQRRNGPGVLPPTTQVLVEQHFLRKKFIDPVSGSAFLVLPGAAPSQGATTVVNSSTAATSPAARGGATSPAGAGRTGGGGTTGSSASGAIGAMEEPKLGNVPGGIAGVVSKNGDESLRVFNGRTHYNEWEFRYIPPPPPPQNQGGDGRGAQGDRGQPPPPGGAGPGGRGRAATGTTIGPDGRIGRSNVTISAPDSRGNVTITNPDGSTRTVAPGVSQPNPRGGGSPFAPQQPAPQRGR